MAVRAAVLEEQRARLWAPAQVQAVQRLEQPGGFDLRDHGRR